VKDVRIGRVVDDDAVAHRPSNERDVLYENTLVESTMFPEKPVIDQLLRPIIQLIN
jgi:hypothetical protein